MSKIFQKIKSSFDTIVLASGLAAYSYLIYNKLNVDRKLAHPVVQEVLERLKHAKEVTEEVGNQFIISTGILKSLEIKANQKRDSMEYSFPITGTKGKTINVYFSAISKDHKSIKNSTEVDSLEIEYYLPSERVHKTISEAQNKDHLQNLLLEDDTRFWKVEYIEGVLEQKQMVDIKYETPAVLYAPRLLKRSTYLDVYQDMLVS